VLFSWESDTGFTAARWDVAVSRADANGLILASSLLSFKNACPDDRVRIISHSLGARVVLSALDRLNNNNS
jgi:esterase/lipase superfamily enzyme